MFGNSGAGKSTLAVHLAANHGLSHLDLDTLAWEPHPPPRRRPIRDSAADLEAFMASQDSWVIEGCYSDLLEVTLPHCTRMIFLNPGVDACVANCRSRPWEPHKYETPEEQDANLAMLIAWVKEYETRDDVFSLRSHRQLFEGFGWEKIEHSENVALADKPLGDAPSQVTT